MGKRAPTLHDLYAMHIPSDLQIAADGSFLVFRERSVDADLDKTVSGLRRVIPGAHPGGAVPEILTEGPISDSQPRISPDGQWIAFCRTRLGEDQKDAPAELCLLPASGGTPRVLVRERGAFGAISWSPESDRLIVSFRRADALPKGRSAPLSIHVDRLFYKRDGEGYLPADRFRLYLVETRSDAPMLTPLPTGPASGTSDWDELQPAWSPDGERIAFLANRRADRDFDVENLDVFVVPAAGGDAVQCTRARGPVFAMAWAPDGSWLAVIACPSPPGNPLSIDNAHLFRVVPNGTDAEVDLTPDLDRNVLNLTVNDLWGLEPMATAPAFSADGRVLYAVVSDRGTTWLGALPVDAEGRARGALTPVVQDCVVMYFAVANEQIALISSTSTEPGRIERCALDGSARELVCWPMAGFCGEIALLEPIELTIPTAQGHEIQGWLLMPENRTLASERGVPMLLTIHGGPVLQYGRALLFEAQTFAARGYAVLYTNPRGSQGYGRAFVSAIKRDWGAPAYDDLMAAVDHVLERHAIDSTRLGVLGGSYGGYMTNWTIAHTHRFKAACTQRTVSYVDGLTWADYGGFLECEFGSAPWEEPELYQRLSPLTYARAIETPLLILQGLGDLRTPSDQGERLYVTLRRMGKHVEMVLFPGANHDLSRNGAPAQRAERLRVLHEWFDRYLAP